MKTIEDFQRSEDDLISLSVRGDDSIIKEKVSVLKAASGYLEKQLEQELDPGNSIVLEPDNVANFNVLELLVGFMQSSVLVPTESSIENLCYGADFLEMNSALVVLFQFLIDQMPTEKSWEMDRKQVLMYLRLLNVISKHLQLFPTDPRRIPLSYCQGPDKIVKTLNFLRKPQFFISYHFKSIMYERSLMELQFRSLYNLLLWDSLRIPEEDVVRTIKMWINYNFEDRINRYRFLLRAVRFHPEMKLEFILEEVLDYSDTAKDYVIAILALRNGYKKDISNSGPVNDKPRNFCPCHK